MRIIQYVAAVIVLFGIMYFGLNAADRYYAEQERDMQEVLIHRK